MKIGELSIATSTSVQTIRYYEKEQLLPAAARSDNNYRVYSQEHLETLLFIRHGRKLGMTLAELRTLLQFRASHLDGCHQVNELLDEQIAEVTQRLEDLAQLRSQLMSLRDRCTGDRGTDHCGILHELSRIAAESAHAHEHSQES